MPRYQITYIFDMPGHGFTESWWVDRDETNLDQIRDIARTVAEARMRLAGDDCTLQAIRISNGSEAGRVGKTYYNPIEGQSGKGSMASNVAMNAQFGTINNDYQKLVQLRGGWDEWEGEGGALLKSDEQLIARFTSYVSALRGAGFGWRSIVSRLEFPITNYVVSAEQVVTLTLDGSTSGIGATNTRRVARVSKLNGKSVLNGAQVIRVSGPNTVDLVKPTAAGDFKSPGVLVVPSYTVRQIANGELQRLGTRQAGAPLLRSRGRASARPRT